MIFLFTFIKAWLMLIQNNTYCWIETTTWTKIKKSPKYKIQSLLYKIRAASDINQKEHFILKKRTPRILPSPVQYLFYVFYIKRKLYVISQNGAASNCWTNKRSRLEPWFYINIGNLSIRSLWYHSNDTKRNPWVMLYSHCPINDSSGYLHNIVYLAVMLQAFWHTVEGN